MPTRFAIADAEHGFRVRFTLATKLVDKLVEAADDKQLARTIDRYGRVDLLTPRNVSCDPRAYLATAMAPLH